VEVAGYVHQERILRTMKCENYQIHSLFVLMVLKVGMQIIHQLS